MNISREKLLAESAATGFRPDVMEKAVQVLGLLEALQGHPLLKGCLALKGGTALNLFLFDVPRLSVDVDVNYIGSEDRDVMVAERPKIEAAVGAVLKREGFQVRRMPHERAAASGASGWPSSPSKRTRGSSSTASSTTARSSHPCSRRRPIWSKGSGGIRHWNGRR